MRIQLPEIRDNAWGGRVILSFENALHLRFSLQLGKDKKGHGLIPASACFSVQKKRLMMTIQ
jgi:hypothetical protein